MRVLVVFGKQKLYTGVIKRLYEESDVVKLKRLKYIDELQDEGPVLREVQLRLFEWLAYYYFCTEGEVMKAALPAGLKPESAMRVFPVEGLEWNDLELANHELQLLEALEVRPSIPIRDVAEIWEVHDPGTRLRNMEGRGLIRRVHELEERYKPKTEKQLTVGSRHQTEEGLHLVFDELSRAPKQEEIMMLVVQALHSKSIITRAEVNKRLGTPTQAIKSLIAKGFLEETEVEVERMPTVHHKQRDMKVEYTEEQAHALESIRTSFSENPTKPILLHGVTGSGKTHLYIDLIHDALEQDKQVLYLLPEIALTQQIIDKVKSEFGDMVGVYHSRFSDHERVEIWEKTLHGEYQVVIGVRSAIFLPFEDLGLIVIDEEHDHSFKQTEPNPRYNARDLAVYAAGVIGCHVILGSATPAFETLYNAREGKYGLVELKNRATDAVLPTISLIDMREQRKKRLSKGVFSNVLFEAITEMKSRGEQGILFQNRRGYSPYLICNTCGYVPRCVNCDITLVYHKAGDQLRCHYCGYVDYQTGKCDQCSNYDYKQQGVGTEKIEEEVNEYFPDVTVKRMDLDTTRTKHAFKNIIHAFERHEYDMLVGTQMVSKGLDFGNVTLVGVVDADQLLTFPDFRAYENAYQLLTQVSGRAGRSAKRGRVLIQTRMDDNIVLQELQKDYGRFYEHELKLREKLNYPPYTRLIKIEVRHKDRAFVESEAESLRKIFYPVFGQFMLGPEYPSVARVRTYYRMVFLFKFPRDAGPKKIREVLRDRIDYYYSKAKAKTLRIMVDVDPI